MPRFPPGGQRPDPSAGRRFAETCPAQGWWVFDNAPAYNIRVVNLSLTETVASSYNPDWEAVSDPRAGCHPRPEGRRTSPRTRLVASPWSRRRPRRGADVRPSQPPRSSLARCET
jgi:hypothetical protein